MEAIMGMIGALLGAGIFVLGFWTGREMGTPKPVKVEEPSAEELAKIKEERDRIIEDQKAFLELVNYNTDTAYKTPVNPLKSG